MAQQLNIRVDHVLYGELRAAYDREIERRSGSRATYISLGRNS